MFDTTKKIGILGGGQLGKMLCLAAANWDFKTYILDKSSGYPAGAVCTGFTEGDFNHYDDVLAFGADKDVLTIEIEHVNTEALRALEAQGKTVHPAPRALEIIKDKGLQKQFYRENDIPTAEFELFDDEHAVRRAVTEGRWTLPCVQKTRTAGYDGRGVAILRTAADLDTRLLPGPCLLEALAPIRAELAVVAARNEADDVAVFPAVEMEFHPEANLVEFLVCPARVSPLVEAEAQALAERVIRTFDVCGLLAVELFLTTNGQLLVNEVAPRPHNSGHHTIDSAATSQFQQHLRAICNLPLGATDQLRPGVMLNLLGEGPHPASPQGGGEGPHPASPQGGGVGPAHYVGMEEALALGGVYVHLYGKAMTAPFRKMGHVTVTGETVAAAVDKARIVQKLIKVISK